MIGRRNLKLSAFLTFLTCCIFRLSVTGFVIKNKPQALAAPRTSHFLSAPAATDGEIKSPFFQEAPEDPYEAIGVSPDNFALGVSPKDFYKYVGSREDLINKSLKDIPSLDRKAAEVEVDKFLLDSEAMNMYINYQKKKEEDPDFVVPEAKDEEGFFSFRNLIIGYVGYVLVTSGPNVFRNWVASKEAAGDWSGTGIPFVDDWIANTPVTLDPSVASEVAKSISDM